MEKRVKAKILQEELEYYTTLLKNYNQNKLKEKLAAAKVTNLVSSKKFIGKHSLSCNFQNAQRHSQSKKNMPVVTNYYQKNKTSHVNKMYNIHNYIKDKSILSTSGKNVMNIKPQVFKSAPNCKNSVSEFHYQNVPTTSLKSCKKIVRNSTNSDINLLVTNEGSKKSSLHPLVLEISALTKQLKKTSESLSSSNKSNLAAVNTKFNTNKKLAHQNCGNSNKAVGNLLVKNIATEKKILCSPGCLSSVSVEQNKRSDINPYVSCIRLDKSVLNASQSKNIPSVSTKKTNSLSPKNNVKLELEKVSQETFFSGSSTSISKYRSLLVKKALLKARKKSEITSKLIASKYKVVNKNSSLDHPVKFQNSLQNNCKKSECLPEVNGFGVVNVKFGSDIVVKKETLKKVQKKLNLKHKIINKTLTPSSNKKKVLKLDCIKNAEQTKPQMPIKKQSSVQKLKNMNVNSNQKLFCVNRISDNISEISQTPLSIKAQRKQCYFLNSKYKVINKNYNDSKRKILLKRCVGSADSFRNISKFSRFSVVHKQSPKKQYASLFIEKPILLKRVYKSKNALVNKNSRPIHHTARMIKTKYFALNRKRPISWHNISRSPKANKLKGHLLNRYCPRSFIFQEKANTMILRSRVIRQHSKLKTNTSTGFKNYFQRKNFSNYKQCSRVQNKQFVVNSSGRKLRRITTPGGNKFLKQMNVGKSSRYSITVKLATPVSKAIASRVLHRSINRVLTASVKKEMTKVNKYCMFYNRFGRCNKGIKCPYIHDPSKIAVCTRFLRGTCKIDGCPFSHEICPGKMAICSFYLLGSCVKSNCPYRHETLSPDTELCKAFVQGYCPHGKECKNAHVLICPQFVQGNCSKGDSCAFPHPPQKAKTITQCKSLDDEEPQELYEKVARYFQPFTEVSGLENESDKKCNITLVSSRSCKLPEQPSYIPLTDKSSSLRSLLPQQPSFLPLSISDDETS